MDYNNQMPPVQPDGSVPVNGGAPMNGVPVNGGALAGTMPPVVGPDGRPMVQQPLAQPVKQRDIGGIVKIIAIIFLALLSMTFIGLFIWMKGEYDHERSRDLNAEIDAAVATARDEVIMEKEAEFLEREKYPYKVFAGPVDYGSLSFEYPKTWSVYVGDSAANGGDFNAYFNPIQVDTVSKDTINALRVTIRNTSFENVVAEYQRALEGRDANLTVESVTVAGTSANRYTGTIPNTELEGIIVIFKIRDKTVIMQTDSMLFKDDFDKLLETVTFNA